MKKLLGIVVLGLLLSGNAYSFNYDVVLKCDVKKFDQTIDFQEFPKIFGRTGDIRFFHIRKKDGQLEWSADSNWDPYEKFFKNWHEGYELGVRFIKFGAWPGRRDTKNSYMRINRETGEIIHLSATDEEITGWYNANCERIKYEELPIKKIEQKF